MAGDLATEDEEEEEVAAPTPIELDCGSFTVAVTSWEQLAEAQMQGLRSNVGTRVRTLDLTPSLRSCWNVLTPHLSRCWNVLTPPS